MQRSAFVALSLGLLVAPLLLSNAPRWAMLIRPVRRLVRPSTFSLVDTIGHPIPSSLCSMNASSWNEFLTSVR